MNLLNQLVQIIKNFGSLGRTRLMILGGVGAASIAIILAAAIFVNKPAQETLYVGLETTDLNQISMERARGGSSNTGMLFSSAISLIFNAIRSWPLARTTGASFSSRT